MTRATGTKPWTADELRRLPEGWRYEIDAGELVIMAPAGFEHGRVTTRVSHVLHRFAEMSRLGVVTTGEPGFYLRHDPETLRAPDVAFYSNERVRRITDRRGFPDVPPDLAVEIHDSTEPDLTHKVQQYLDSGVRAVWVIDRESRSLTRYAPGEAARMWTDPDAAIDEPVLPGFSCQLSELLGEA